MVSMDFGIQPSKVVPWEQKENFLASLTNLYLAKIKQEFNPGNYKVTRWTTPQIINHITWILYLLSTAFEV